MQLILDDEQVDSLLKLAGVLHHNPILRSIAEKLKERIADAGDPVGEAFRAAAKEYMHEGDLELDDNAPVSISEDGGAYVQCWQWIDDDEAGYDRETGTVAACAQQS